MLSSVSRRWLTLAFIYLLLILQRIFVHCATVDLDWVSYNPLFSTSGLQMLRRDVRINDRIRFSCSHDGTEHVAIHRVSEREAFSCERFSKFTDALVGTCTKANDSVIIRLRELPMLPNELSYKPNHDYFFISTSTGTADGLENSKGGLCASRKMRIQLHVKPRIDTTVDDSQMNTDDSFAGAKRVMLLPVDSRQYPVPVMYVPVNTANENVQDDGNRRLRLPYHLYVPSSHLQRNILNSADIVGERAVSNGAIIDHPYRPHVALHHSSSVMNDQTDKRIHDSASTAVSNGAIIDHPYRPHVALHHSSSVMNDQTDKRIHDSASTGDHFDAQDEPLRPFEAPGMRAYPRDHFADQLAKPTALRSDDERDFEVEYVDLHSQGYRSAVSNSLLAIAVCIIVIALQYR
ncbi:Ephrin-B1 [Toxocara canis]|uniref:Ephrin-B1 n=1 Tax=Toxocara canis TaxID=6265 RepID=A0A0B2VJS2_TOXCA|nr:Ephrin-B1 [Toxocara canis]